MNNSTSEINVTLCDIKTFSDSYKGIHGYASLFVCLLGSVANSLNIVVLTRKEMRSPTNTILTGLAVADLLVMVEYIPYVYLSSGDKSYEVTAFILFHSHFSQVFHTVSIFLTVALAVWRYIAIAHPQRSRVWLKMETTVISIAVTYIMAVVVCIPNFISFGIVPRSTANSTKYLVGPTSLAMKHDSLLLKIDFWMYSVCIKLIPCVLLTILSMRLIYALMKAKERRSKLSNSGNLLDGEKKNRPSVKKSTKLVEKGRQADRTTKMLLAVLLLFLITEFPHGILALIAGILGDTFLNQCYMPFGDILDILALINSAINFMIYCSMSRQFRITFSMLFKPKVLDKWMPVARFPATDTDTTQVTQV